MPRLLRHIVVAFLILAAGSFAVALVLAQRPPYSHFAPSQIFLYLLTLAAIAAASCVALAWWLPRVASDRLHRRRVIKGRCSRCGYRMGASTHCSECGHDLRSDVVDMIRHRIADRF